MTTKRKVRADFDKSQPITVNMRGCSVEEDKQVQQAFFDIGIEWGFGGDSYGLLEKNFYTNTNTGGVVEGHLMWLGARYISDNAKPITPKQFLAMVYEDEPQGHPHAELMMAYAEDAKKYPAPWKLWQTRGYEDFPEKWFGIHGNPQWDVSMEYRRKPKTHLVHGVEVPDLRVKPEYGDRYYCPSPTEIELVDDVFFTDTLYNDTHRVDYNLCYEYTEAGKQAAILHSKALLGIAQQEQ